MKHHKGIHHITVLAGNPKRNAQFYTEVLGMRLVKKSVNQDDPGTYHLFYGNQAAEPGSSLTFFPWPNAVQGKASTGEVVNVALQASASSRKYWENRLRKYNVTFKETEVFGRPAFRFHDPDMLELDIIFEGGAKPKTDNVSYVVEPEFAIQGFWGARLKLTEKEYTEKLIHELFDFNEVERDENHILYQTDAPIGHSLIFEITDFQPGRNGRGTVHHIAFRAKNREELDELRKYVFQEGLHPTHIIDRHWFKSVYYRIPEGVLFEMASDDPGYTVDEEFEELGEHLILPPWLESKRDQIERRLPDLTVPAS
ncbi:MAG: ring-cleaving dioxygenase [Balneolaceae bacterium]|nr:ring-cleaving dioxygenase [Balneolaceae bacterium]